MSIVFTLDALLMEVNYFGEYLLAGVRLGAKTARERLQKDVKLEVMYSGEHLLN